MMPPLVIPTEPEAVSRTAGPILPIVALSVRGDEDTAGQALRVGADDYGQKLFRVNELLALVSKALRRLALASFGSGVAIRPHRSGCPG